MYRSSDDLPDREDAGDAAPSAEPHGSRSYSPVPLGVFAGLLALFGAFFGLFLLAWGMAPTSIGCGAERSVSMVAAFTPIALLVYGAVSWAGIGIMRDSRQPQLRLRSFVITSGVIYAVGVVPLYAMAALLGSCFDF